METIERIAKALNYINPASFYLSNASCLSHNSIEELLGKREFKFEGCFLQNEKVYLNNGTNIEFTYKFITYPIQFGIKKWNDKVPEDCHVFTLCVDTAWLTTLELLQEKVFFDHFEGAFAVIRFYIRDDSIIIVEIQSDIFPQITINKIRTCLRNWYKTMLLAFHHYVLNILPDMNKIYLVNEDYIKKRFPEIKPSTCKRFYHDLPLYYGYDAPMALNKMLEPKTNPRLIDQAWHCSTANLLLNSDYVNFEKRYYFTKHNRIYV